MSARYEIGPDLDSDLISDFEREYISFVRQRIPDFQLPPRPRIHTKKQIAARYDVDPAGQLLPMFNSVEFAEVNSHNGISIERHTEVRYYATDAMAPPPPPEERLWHEQGVYSRPNETIGFGSETPVIILDFEREAGIPLTFNMFVHNGGSLITPSEFTISGMMKAIEELESHGRIALAT